MRIVVTGHHGQIVSALIERAPPGVTIVPLGRPGLDLARPETVAPALLTQRTDCIINAAAYTAVDQAESEEALATRINGDGAGAVAAVARQLGVPLIQLSTDYVFDGMLDRACREHDPVSPISAYGRSKLAGERAVAAATGDFTILRTAWVYSPFGRNFVKTMLRLGTERSEVAVVADQLGCPTNALDLADAIFAVASNLIADETDYDMRGVFHMTARGQASWADVAEAVFAEAAALGRPAVTVRRIRTADYPTPACRPANSRLDGYKLSEIHGVVLPEWRGSLRACVRRLLAAERSEQAR